MTKKATDLEVVHPRILILGDYGMGKTYLTGLIHEAYKKAGSKGLYLFDFDKGYPTLKTAGFDVDLDVYVDKNVRNPNAWTDFVKHIEKFEKDAHDYGAIAIDSLTSLQAAALNYVIKINPLDNRRFMLTTQNDYGVLVGIMNQLLPQFINISERMAVIMCAHIRLDKDETTGRIQFTPAITGRALPSSIGGWFNEVWKVKVNGYGTAAQRVVQVMSDDKISCKTQMLLSDKKGKPVFELPPNELVDELVKQYGIKDLAVAANVTQTQTTQTHTTTQTTTQTKQ